MKQYNVFLKEMKCKKKVEEKGFNCGREQGGDYFGDFEVENILPVGEENYIKIDKKLKGGKNGIKCK